MRSNLEETFVIEKSKEKHGRKFIFEIFLKYNFSDEHSLQLDVYKIVNSRTGQKILAVSTDLTDYLPYDSIYDDKKKEDVIELSDVINDLLNRVIQKDSNVKEEINQLENAMRNLESDNIDD